MAPLKLSLEKAFELWGKHQCFCTGGHADEMCTSTPSKLDYAQILILGVANRTVDPGRIGCDLPAIHHNNSKVKDPQRGGRGGGYASSYAIPVPHPVLYIPLKKIAGRNSKCGSFVDPIYPRHCVCPNCNYIGIVYLHPI